MEIERSFLASHRKQLEPEVLSLLREEGAEFLVNGTSLEKVTGKAKNIPVFLRLSKNYRELECKEQTASTSETSRAPLVLTCSAVRLEDVTEVVGVASQLKGGSGKNSKGKGESGANCFSIQVRGSSSPFVFCARNRAEYVRWVDGLRGLLNSPYLCTESNSDVSLLCSLLGLATMYGPPVV